MQRPRYISLLRLRRISFTFAALLHMSLPAAKKISNKTILAIIMLIAALFRLTALTHQSLWLDELHTMNVSDPSLPWSHLFHTLKYNDQHPPLFFVLERLLFAGLGYTEWVSRLLPAVAGIISVWAMYRLGREILSERLGLLAAAITCLNIYNLIYSQEARDYMLLWLFTILSYLFLIRLFKYLRVKDAVYYVIFTTLLLYTHYFSLILLCCQFILGIIFLVAVEKENRKRLFLIFVISAASVVLLYLPLLPFLKEVSGIHSFWIGKVGPLFFVDFYYEYFNNAIVIYTPLIFYFIYVAIKKFNFRGLRYSPLGLAATFIFVSIFFAYLIPYIRSVLVVPMLITRYTIITVPSFTLCIAYGLELIPNSRLRYWLLSVALLLSLADIFFIKKFYAPRNAQFREMTAYMAEGNKNYPFINERCGWQQAFYLKKYHYTGILLTGKKEDLVDSILSGRNKIDTFWIVGSHGDPKLAAAKRRQLDTAYVLLKEKEFHIAWAQLFARRAPN